MTVKELREWLEAYSDDIMVYVEADHGQMPEQAGGTKVSDSELLYYGEDMNWEPSETQTLKDITAICIY